MSKLGLLDVLAVMVATSSSDQNGRLQKGGGAQGMGSELDLLRPQISGWESLSISPMPRDNCIAISSHGMQKTTMMSLECVRRAVGNSDDSVILLEAAAESLALLAQISSPQCFGPDADEVVTRS